MVNQITHLIADLPDQEVAAVEAPVFFQAGGLGVVLWGRDQLPADAGVDDTGASFGGIALAHNVRSTEEVDDVVARAAAAGASITRAPATTFYGGYAGCFRDLDGHVWEIAYNPGFLLDDAGNLTIPDFTGPDFTGPDFTGSDFAGSDFTPSDASV